MRKEEPSNNSASHDSTVPLSCYLFLSDSEFKHLDPNTLSKLGIGDSRMSSRELWA